MGLLILLVALISFIIGNTGLGWADSLQEIMCPESLGLSDFTFVFQGQMGCVCVCVCVCTDHLFIWVLRPFQHCTGHIMTSSFMGRGNQYIQLVMVLYCKLPTNGKQLPAFPLEVRPGTKLQSQRLEVRVLPLCHRGPFLRSLECEDNFWEIVPKISL